MLFALDGDAHAANQLVLTAVAVFVARMVNVPRLFDWGFCVAMAFNGWGDALRLLVPLIARIIPAICAPRRLP